MKVLKTFSIPERKDSRKGDPKTYREACRIVMFDENNCIPILYVSHENYHKLPGGGIDEDEDKMKALQREAIEETGCEIQVDKEIGAVVESNASWEQKSYCYTGKVLSKGKVSFTDSERERGFQLIRVSLQEAITLIRNDNPTSQDGERIQQRDLFILETIIKAI